MKLTALKGKNFIRLKDGLTGPVNYCGPDSPHTPCSKTRPGKSHSQKANQFKSQEGYLAPRFSLRNLKGNLEGLDDHSGKVICC